MRDKRPYERRAQIDEPYMTLQQIADTMGCSREMIRQIEESALRKCRKRLRAMGVNPEDFFNDPTFIRGLKEKESEDD